MNFHPKSILVLVSTLLFLAACNTKQNHNPKLLMDQVHQHQLSDIRLGDGVPLKMGISVRWNVVNADHFFQQFPTTDTFNLMVIGPRMEELVSKVSNYYPSVDSVFGHQRMELIQEVKRALLDNLGEPSVAIKEIIVSDIDFPLAYTQAKELLGTQQQELLKIRNQNIVDLEKATAARKKTEADAKINIAQAEAEGRLQKLKAKTEESIRKSALAKAETASQVSRMQAKADAERKKLLAKADLENRRDLKNLDVQKQKDLMLLDVRKQKEMDKVEFDKQIEFAKLCQNNPTYASFLINKELAGKVDIAVLPSGTDSNVFGNILNNTMSNKTKN